jgi:endonuclease/exonuclease/phosphatase family metal-dependent hydrolase
MTLKDKIKNIVNTKFDFEKFKERAIYKRNFELSWFNKLMVWLNYFSVIAILLSYCAQFINPHNFWPIAFLGLAYPVLLYLNLFFILYWLVQLKLFFIWSLLIIVFGWNSFFSVFQIPQKQEPVNKNDVKIMSYNSMLFDLYNWSNNKKSRDIIFSMLKSEAPDILCLQEFYTSEEENDFNNIDTVKETLNLDFDHVYYTTTMRKYDHWGIATFSKFPIIRKGSIEFNTRWNNSCIYTDILVNNDTVRVYNMHLASIHFGKKEHEYIKEIMSHADSIELNQSKNIIRLLKNAFLLRAQQASIVAEHINKCKYKTIVCGDFNDTPNSFAYRKVKGKLIDCFRESGEGISSTYAGKIPGIRIDYIMHDKSIKSYNYKRIKNTITDHYPITTVLKLHDE